MMLLGHATPSTFKRYQIVAQSDLDDAVRRLDAYTAQQAAQKPTRKKPSRFGS